MPFPQFHSLRSTFPARVLGVAIAATTLLSGCYTYRTVPLSELAPDQTVRVELTAVAVDRLRNSANNEGRLLEGFTVNGTVARASADSVVVSVPTTTSTDPTMRPVTFHQPLSLMRSDVQRADLRVLDRQRSTVTAVILGLLTVAAAVYAVERGGESTGTTPVPGGPNEIRLPLQLRWSVR